MSAVNDDIARPATVRILLVEDDKIDQLAFRRFVADKELAYDLSVAGSIAEAMVALSAAKFDLLIVDYSLGDGTALDLLAQTQGVPFVIVTGAGSEAIAVHAMQAGAYDYLIKDFDRNYLRMMPITVTKTIGRYREEETTKQFYGELESMAREKTRELVETNRSLQAALVLAEAGATARSEFLANITHELVTPLNSVIGFSQVLLDGLSGTLNEKQRGFAEAIRKNGERLNETYNEILQIAGLASGSLQLQLERFPLKNLLESSLQVFGEKTAEKSVTLTLASDVPTEIKMNADRAKLQQVVFNLLDNAVKFTERGGSVSVRARLTAEEGGDASILISVEDTGIGIKGEDLARLFQPFQQLEPAFTKRYQGTGTGLILAKKLVELHDGRIWVESEFGKGSTFTLQIPVQQSQGQGTEGVKSDYQGKIPAG